MQNIVNLLKDFIFERLFVPVLALAGAIIFIYLFVKYGAALLPN